MKKGQNKMTLTILAALIRGQMILLYLKHESDEAREPMGRKYNTT